MSQVVENENLNIGFDAANEAMVDMIATGIIDPAKVSHLLISLIKFFNFSFSRW